MLRDSRAHRVIDLVPFYPKGTCLKSKKEGIVKQSDGLRVLARGLNTVRNWLLELSASRSDISLDTAYDSEGRSLTDVISEVIGENDERDRVCHWDRQRRALREALYFKSGILVLFDYTLRYNQA